MAEAREETKLEEMLRLGKPPGAVTDREFLRGRCNGNQFERNPKLGDFYAAEAKRQGVDITGRVYLSGLAEYPGDPRAWVSSRGEVKKLCEERGYICDGLVKHKPPAPDFEPSGGGIAKDIVDDLVEDKLLENPEARVEDVREAVIDQHAPYWAKREV